MSRDFHLGRMRSSDMDAFIKCDRGSAQRFERHGSCNVGETHKPFSTMQGQATDRAHCLGSIEQSKTFLNFQLQRLNLSALKCDATRQSLALLESFAFTDGNYR